MLGSGPDRYTYSLFLGHNSLRKQTAWVIAETNSPKPPPKRISLTLPVVTNSSSICHVTTYDEVEDALRKIFRPRNHDQDQLPASLVNQRGAGKASWFVDDAAVEGL